jgi:cellulose synthase/poly-beta-1,6-N-acetylglucosamine synthase-like glycosyltransferase
MIGGQWRARITACQGSGEAVARQPAPAFATPPADDGASNAPGRRSLVDVFEPILLVATIAGSGLAFLLIIAYVTTVPGLPASDRVIYGLLLSCLFYCCACYELNRLGTALRRRRHCERGEEALAYLFAPSAPSVTVLVPTYREEPRVVGMTVLSAALARYSNRRIVVLVDDPPTDRASLDRTRAAIAHVRELVARPMLRLRADAGKGRLRLLSRRYSVEEESRRIAASYDFAAGWLDELAARRNREVAPEFAHVDNFVTERVVVELAARYRRHADAIRRRPLDPRAIELEYRALGQLFCTDITAFERKRFENLSHAPNKAMNLNSYIGLIGGRYDVVEAQGRTWIVDAGGPDHALAIPPADYLLTLDADSVILGDYLLHLVDVLEGDPTLAVAQTPYRSFPGSASAVERIAGATTDIQYLSHQGSTYFNAAYWVGANALIRFAALKEIGREQVEAGKRCSVYIQDQTVIEDTGSTIDLLKSGRLVYNYLAPLAYSATPADFGALSIQRSRWSNGGLIIFPMLLRQYLAAPGMVRRIPELILRSSYLLSPVIGNTAVFFLMIWASAEASSLLWTPLIMIPYFILYGIDLARLGYRFRDVFAVCALNLMLLPVSLAGVGASIQQMITGRKGRFSRTPKVANRTFIPPPFFIFNSFMLLLMLYYVLMGIFLGKLLGTIVPAINVGLYAYGLHRFVGIAEGLADLRLTLADAATALETRFAAIAAASRAALRPRGFVGVRAFGTAAVFALLMLTPWQIGSVRPAGDSASAIAGQDDVLDRRGSMPTAASVFSQTGGNAGFRGGPGERLYGIALRPSSSERRRRAD